MKTEDRPMVSFDRAKLKRFKKAYADTKGFEDTYVFEFEGHEYVRAFARYLIEYLEGKL